MDDANLKRQLGGAIREARTAAGLSQKALAAEVGVEQAQMSRYERGEYLVALDTITAIDRACKQPLGYVLRLAGLVEDSADSVSAVRTDPTIPTRVRDALVAIIEDTRGGEVADPIETVTAELASASAKAPGRRRRPGPARSA